MLMHDEDFDDGGGRGPEALRTEVAMKVINDDGENQIGNEEG